MSRQVDWDRQPSLAVGSLRAIRREDCDGGTNIDNGTPLAEWFFMPTERHSELFRAMRRFPSGSRALEENGPLRG